MNVAVLLSTASAATAVTVGLVSLQVARGRAWSDHRWLAGAALASAFNAAGNVAVASGTPAWAALAVSRVQTAGCFLALYCWFELTRGLTRVRRGELERWIQPVLLICAAVELVPGATYSGVVDHPFPAWGVTYRDAVPTALGAALLLFANANVLVVLVRAVLAWRQGVRHCGLLAVAFATLFVTGVNDALASMSLASPPYLLDIGFLLPVFAVALASTARFVGDAKALVSLRDRLEEVVADRTEALSRSQWALHQAEKLASLGRFAVVLAEEVQGPVRAARARLAGLERALRDGSAAADPAALAEVHGELQAVDDLAKKLVEGGRLALAPESAGGTRAQPVALRAAEEARAYCDERVAVEVAVNLFTEVAVSAEVLHQVLSALLLDAVDRIPRGRGGRVELRSADDDDGLERLTVSSDGLGTVADVPRPSESIFSSQRASRRGELRLALARALVERHGGRLELEALPGGGSLAVLRLPAPPPRVPD